MQTNNLSTNIKSQKNLKKPKNNVGTEAKEWRKNSLAAQQNKMKDLWKRGIVTKVIRSKTDQMPRTIQLRTEKSKKIIRPIQKSAIPEWEILDEDDSHPTSQVLSIENIAIPELTEQEDIQQYLSLKPEI